MTRVSANVHVSSPQPNLSLIVFGAFRSVQSNTVGCFEPNDEQHDEGPAEEGNAIDVGFVIKRRDSLREVDEAEAIRRAVTKIVRYERRAAKKRDDAVRRFLQLRQCQNRQKQAGENVGDADVPDL